MRVIACLVLISVVFVMIYNEDGEVDVPCASICTDTVYQYYTMNNVYQMLNWTD